MSIDSLLVGKDLKLTAVEKEHVDTIASWYRAIKLYEKVGFKKEGTYREFIHRDGKRYDLYMYGILRREWESMR